MADTRPESTGEVRQALANILADPTETDGADRG